MRRKGVMPPVAPLKLPYIPKPLNSETTDMMKMTYGASSSLPLKDIMNEPNTPTECLRKAGEYLFKQEDLGFIKKTGRPRDDPLDYFKENMKVLNINSKSKDADHVTQEDLIMIQDNYGKDKAHTFCSNSSSIKNALRRLSDLVFCSKSEQIISIDTFFGKVLGLVRGKKYQILYDGKNHNKLQLVQVTQDLIDDVNRICHDTIKQQIELDKVLIDSLTPAQINEFGESIQILNPAKKIKEQEQPKEQESENDSVILIEHNVLELSTLPSIYRPKTEMLSRKYTETMQSNMKDEIMNGSRTMISNLSARAEDHRTPESHTKRVATAASIPNYISKQVFRNDHGKIPVPKRPKVITNVRYSSSFRSCSVPTKEPKLTLPSFTQYDFSESDQKTEGVSTGDPAHYVLPTIDLFGTKEREMKRIEKENKKKTFGQVSEFHINDLIDDPETSTDEEHPKEEELPKPNNYIFPGDGLSFPMTEFGTSRYSQLNDSMTNPLDRFDKRTPIEIIKDAQEIYKSFDNDLHPKLEAIWDNLEFSTQQRLGMVIKYTENINNSEKLEEALAAWEGAYKSVMEYRKSYVAYKNFLRNTQNFSENAFEVEDALKSEYDKEETNVKLAEKMLWTNFNDVLIYRRKKVSEVISIYSTKLATIKSQSAMRWE